eukprot:CFRG3864T1
MRRLPTTCRLRGACERLLIRSIRTVTARGSYYETLGVTSRASHHEIKKQFIALSKELHPDLHMNSPCSRESVMTRYGHVRQAYDILIDPLSRREYDQDLHSTRFNGTSTRHAEVYNATSSGKSRPFGSNTPTPPESDFGETSFGHLFLSLLACVSIMGIGATLQWSWFQIDPVETRLKRDAERLYVEPSWITTLKKKNQWTDDK